MKAKRWTLGVVLAAAVSLWGLIEADASPFSSYVLTDDLSNQVNGVAPDGSSWGGSLDGSSSSSTDSGGKDNNGNGNNEDGVDSSNPGNGGGGPNGSADESCPDPNNCVDDEISKSK
jgi:hypothetical protein